MTYINMPVAGPENLKSDASDVKVKGQRKGHRVALIYDVRVTPIFLIAVIARVLARFGLITTFDHIRVDSVERWFNLGRTLS